MCAGPLHSSYTNGERATSNGAGNQHTTTAPLVPSFCNGHDTGGAMKKIYPNGSSGEDSARARDVLDRLSDIFLDCLTNLTDDRPLRDSQIGEEVFRYFVRYVVDTLSPDGV